MPKSPLDVAIDTIDKVQRLHTQAEQVRGSLDRIDPISTATGVLSDLTSKINELDMALVRTKRRGRRAPPKTSTPQ